MNIKNLESTVDELKTLAEITIKDCTFKKNSYYFGVQGEVEVLLPSGDEKYRSFWVRDAAMMAESGLIPDRDLKRYVEIFATHAQNGADELVLENGLRVPPYALADHVNYDGGAVFYPGTYSSGTNQGVGRFGFLPPFCDNYYFIMMVGAYIAQSGDYRILNNEYAGLSLYRRLEYAFDGYNIDKDSGLCECSIERYAVDWGFVDTVKKSGKLLMASLLRYNAAIAMERITAGNRDAEKSRCYVDTAKRIKNAIIDTFYDAETGWLYSATGVGRQHDVWATAYAVFSGITSEEKTLSALYAAYKNKTAVIDGYVRHILLNEDFSDNSAWESTITPHNVYQNGAFWATPTGWYAYALYKYDGSIDILKDFLAHTKKNRERYAPFEWIDESGEKVSGLRYGTSGVLPYIGAKRILDDERSTEA